MIDVTPRISVALWYHGGINTDGHKNIEGCLYAYRVATSDAASPTLMHSREPSHSETLQFS